MIIVGLGPGRLGQLIAINSVLNSVHDDVQLVLVDRGGRRIGDPAVASGFGPAGPVAVEGVVEDAVLHSVPDDVHLAVIDRGGRRGGDLPVASCFGPAGPAAV